MLPKRSKCPKGHRLSVDQTERHFYFFFLFPEEDFLLSRKARNATIKLPKVTNSVSIPMKIEIISNAVILRTSLPMYSLQARGLIREAATLSWLLSSEKYPFSLAHRHAYDYIINSAKFQSIYTVFCHIQKSVNSYSAYIEKVHRLPGEPMDFYLKLLIQLIRES